MIKVRNFIEFASLWCQNKVSFSRSNKKATEKKELLKRKPQPFCCTEENGKVGEEKRAKMLCLLLLNLCYWNCVHLIGICLQRAYKHSPVQAFKISTVLCSTCMILYMSNSPQNHCTTYFWHCPHLTTHAGRRTFWSCPSTANVLPRPKTTEP